MSRMLSFEYLFTCHRLEVVQSILGLACRPDIADSIYYVVLKFGGYSKFLRATKQKGPSQLRKSVTYFIRLGDNVFKRLLYHWNVWSQITRRAKNHSSGDKLLTTTSKKRLWPPQFCKYDMSTSILYRTILHVRRETAKQTTVVLN